MENPHYTPEQQDAIGARLADVLQLRKDKEHKTRYMTLWGPQTNIGIFNTILRIAETVQSGGNL